PGRDHLLAAIAALLCSGLLLPACALIRYKSGLVKAGHAFFLHLFFAALGWCAYASGDARNRPDWFGHRPDSTAMAVVRISEAPRARHATTRYTVEALYSRHRNAVTP